MPDTITALTFADLTERFAEVGVNAMHITAGLGELPRIDVEGRGVPTSPLVLVVTTYALDSQGKRYIDTETQSAAKETRRFRIAGDLRLIPATTQPEGDTNG
jgi:hypothetical protein